MYACFHAVIVITNDDVFERLNEAHQMLVYTLIEGGRGSLDTGDSGSFSATSAAKRNETGGSASETC